MAYGFNFVDDLGITWDDSIWTLQFLDEVVITGEVTNATYTVPLELPPSYDIYVSPQITFVPNDTIIPYWQNHVGWATLSITSTKDTVGPTYGVTFNVTLLYATLGKQANDVCQTINGTTTSLAAFKSQIKTTLRLLGGSSP